MSEPLHGAAYALDLCARIARCTETPGAITRLFLSPATHQVHALLQKEMQTLGMSVRVDAAGNLRGIYPGETSDAPLLLLGSHLDTVPDAGAFDGVLGVAMPFALLRGFGGRRLAYAIEVIAFSEEEGVRFKLPFIGSRAATGTLSGQALLRTDDQGISIAQAIRNFGLSPEDLGDARLTPNTFAFIECHIEQGPVLEALHLPLGVVTAIAGQTRLAVSFTGRANHAGTTPMHLRQDALAAAAAWITAVEQHAQQQPGLVATVGSITVAPGAANVVPASALLSLDVRHAGDAPRLQAVAHLLAAAERIAQARGVKVSAHETSRQDAVALDDRLCHLLAASVATTGALPHRMVSGAGHDAMILAPSIPTALLFLRTPAGLSHHPAEAVAAADVQIALDAMMNLLTRLEQEDTRQWKQ